MTELVPNGDVTELVSNADFVFLPPPKTEVVSVECIGETMFPKTLLDVVVVPPKPVPDWAVVAPKAKGLEKAPLVELGPKAKVFVFVEVGAVVCPKLKMPVLVAVVVVAVPPNMDITGAAVDAPKDCWAAKEVCKLLPNAEALPEPNACDAGADVVGAIKLCG